MDGLFMVQEDLHSLNKLFVDGVEEGVLGLDLVLQQHLHHLKVLVVDGHKERRPAQRVDTIDVDGSILPTVLEHAENIFVYQTETLSIQININIFKNFTIKNIFLPIWWYQD